MARKSLADMNLGPSAAEEEPAPSPAPEVAPVATPDPPRSTAAASRPTGRRRTTGADGEGAAYPHKVSFYQSAEDTARVRGAILHTNVAEGPRNISQFIHAAVMREVERLERKYNDGEQFPAVGPHVLR